MANEEHLAIIKLGVEAWNQWRRENVETNPDLCGAKLGFINLSGVNLSESDLSNAYLRAATLKNACLRGATLIGTDIINADLSNADLSSADLRGADLNGADLNGANLIAAKFNEANLSHANFSNADLSGASLRRAQLIKTRFNRAILADCSIFGVSAWGVELDQADQRNLIITDNDEPIITVDDLEVAQFIYLLLNHKKLRIAINSVTERGVLLLGRFGDGGLEVLQLVAAKLRQMNYLPIIFDFDRPEDRDYTETIKVLVGLSRFIVVDLSGPSVPQELYATVPHFDIPFVPIIEKGRKMYSMSIDLWKYEWFLTPPVEFASKEELIELISSKIVDRAEERHHERQLLLDKIFNH
jgi:uncharacterized protein YjbI with pentapeptide repeats